MKRLYSHPSGVIDEIVELDGVGKVRSLIGLPGDIMYIEPGETVIINGETYKDYSDIWYDHPEGSYIKMLRKQI